MKILMVTPYFWPKIGGLERYAYEIARRLVQRGHTVDVITSGPATSVEWLDGMTVHRLKARWTISNNWLSYDASTGVLSGAD